MVEPISAAAVSAMLSAVGTGVGGEVGKQLSLMVGGLFGRGERASGRRYPPGSWEGMAPSLLVGAAQDPALARQLLAVAELAVRSLGAVPRVQGMPRLPDEDGFFQDRDKPLARLAQEARRTGDGRPRRAMLVGDQGIGTTGLAIRFGRREAEELFPDGQLYLDLRGDEAGVALDASLALRHALLELGLTPDQVPRDLAGRARLFREVLDGRRLLIVLDHAHSAAQVRPLLTSAPGVFTLIVGRRRLPGVDAAVIELGPLPDRYAGRLLGELAGDRKLVDRAQVARCGGYPQRLWTVGLALAAGQRPDREREGRDAMPDEDPLHAILEDSYRSLDPVGARLYRRTALWPWPVIRPAVAAAAAETDPAEAARLLEVLADLNLLERLQDGGYRHRPAVREHAERKATVQDGAAGSARAMRRAITAHQDFAVAAARAAHPQGWRVSEAFRAVSDSPYPDAGTALAALRDELPALVQAVLAAAEFGLGEHACAVCEALWPVQLRDGRFEEVLPALRAAARVADEQFPGTRLAARMHTFQALALIEYRDFEEAERQAKAALEAEQRAEHLRGQATATEVLGLVSLAQWEFAEADRRFAESESLLDGIGPEDDGAADLPRIRALLKRHRGRALRGLAMREQADWEDAEDLLRQALDFFRRPDPDTGTPGSRTRPRDPYNTARTLTDLAELHYVAGRPAQALPLIDEAETLLNAEDARYHVGHLQALREQCLNDPGAAQG